MGKGLRGYKIGIMIQKGIIYLFLLIFAMGFLLPFFFLLTGSFKTSSELFSVPFRWFPKRITLENYQQVFTKIPFFRYLKNTVIIVVLNIIGALASNSLIAYGFSRLRWPGRDKIFIIVIATMILPYQVTLIPLYLMYTKIGWIGTFLPLTLPGFFGNAFFIFLMRQFLVGIPKELTESARIDGAGEFTIFLKLMMPISKPVLATVAIMSFMNSWKDFLGPLVFLGSDRLYTLSLAASMLRSNLNPNWELLLALGVVMVLPVLILFFVLQKYFIQGITMSGIKG
ncbi:carbohydrate ABC transporter permease [Butyrivibrio sp. INlla21]|uniref:carbohydrate ABC transporter permease n=1 Tax=Butyrivibrio sp. INlla21 TaxID=1520811 RepID=UPI0008EDC5AD|nr:carbohydrate ABC transporter permease [Butyrivibrio sp. INlla21]SFU88445.1 multiple sugar transport system permease protein [Butyrivibrio sp. INlla21]